MSHASAISKPPPIANPFTAAISGLSRSKREHSPAKPLGGIPAAVLTGNSVRSLSVSVDTSGLTETLTPQGSFFSQAFISSAGYLTAIAFGALHPALIMVVMHGLLLPINIYRTAEMVRLTRI